MKLLNLVYFPFAGGSSFSIDSLKDHLPQGWNLVSLEYPGHGTRWNDSLIDQPEELLEELENQIYKKIDADLPTVFMGYSFGSLLAFKLASRLSWVNLIGLTMISAKPPSLVVSGRGNSSHLASDEALKKHILSLGGIPDEIAQSDVMMNIVLPIIKADLICYSTIEFDSLVSDFPIIFFYGHDDPIFNEEHSLAWHKATTNKHGAKIMKLEGGHFCHKSNESLVIKSLSSWIDLVSPPELSLA